MNEPRGAARGLSPLVRTPFTTDIRNQLVVLGSGTSVGVPALGCGCPVCQGGHPKNQRTRCSVIAGLPQGNLLIDTSPEMRIQLLRERIGVVHAVAFTHSHADHMFGLDDLRLFPFYLGHPVPLYCESKVEDKIRHTFDYAFSEHPESHPGSRPKLVFHTISTKPFEALGSMVTPLRLHHGPNLEILGFRIGDIAYCTDTNFLPKETFQRLEGLDVLLLDALRPRPHVTHFGLEEAIDVAERIGARQTYFTHVSHELDHEETNRQLPTGMELAYDGLRLELRGN